MVSPRALDVSRAQDAMYANLSRNHHASRQSNRDDSLCCGLMDGPSNQRRYNNNVMMVMKPQGAQAARGHQFQWNRLTAPGSGSSSSCGRVASHHQKPGRTWKRHVAEDLEQRKLVVVADLQQPGHRKVVVQAQLGICVSQQPLQQREREVVISTGPGLAPALPPAHAQLMSSSSSAVTSSSRSRTLRLQSARKKKYCYAFTRSGRCSKGEAGRCHYIHDAAKVAVCTRFVTDVCGDADCRLTHRLIPERMPDCVHFLRGLCINERCPYRHVKTDAKAAICEQFLQGSCPDASRCDSKHTYDSPRATCRGTPPLAASAASAPGPPLNCQQDLQGDAIFAQADAHQRHADISSKRKRDAGCCTECSSDIPIPADMLEDDIICNKKVQTCSSYLYAARLGQLHQAIAAGGEIGSYIKPAFVM